MIKKIDANEYGVVRYAITSVDELNRLPKKIAPSSQAILIENGLRVFVYGDGQWVEEVVDGDLSENMQSIVADYERSKIGYDGVKRGSLEERLKDDFQGIYDILNARDYCEYSGKELKVDNTWMGNQIDTRVEGRTLQNLIPTEWIVDSNVGGHATYNVDTKVISAICDGSNSHARFYGDSFLGLIRAGSTYTICFKTRRAGSSVNRVVNLKKYDSDGNIAYMDSLQFTANEGVTQHVYSFRVYNSYENTDKTQLRFVLDSISDGSLDIYDIVLLEGDHTQTPLSELPYFEGIESVGEREIGKNLLDPSELEYGSIVDGAEANNEGYITNRKRSGFIKVKPNTDYVFSSNLEEPDTNWWFYDVNKKYIGKGVYIQTITTPSNCEYIRIHNGHADGTPLSDFKLQVEEGTVATEYEPFGYIIKGKSCGKNLFDKNNAEIVPWYIAQGESNNQFIKAVTLRGFTFKSKFNTNYVITKSYEIENNCFRVYGSKEYPKLNGIGEHLAHKDGQGQISFNSGDNRYITCMCYTIKTDENAELEEILKVFDTIQVEEGVDTTGYEPYQESTYSIHSPIPLRSLPSGVCDVYDFESGAVIQRVGKVVLDGSENWLGYESYDDDVTKWFRVDGLIKANNRFLSCISDKFICVMSSTHTLTGVGEVLSISPTSNGRLNLRINKDKLSSLDVNGFKLWLQTNPTTVCYELEEPIIHYLTPSQLKSFDGTTHVISENTLIPTTTTKILTDTYANVSNVNSTAYSLRRGVNGVAETSAIINETDVEQDDVLDVTMCAIDELYSMLEPNLE